MPNKEFPLSHVTYDAEHIAFTFEKPGQPESTWETYDLTRKAGDRVASGTMTIGGGSIVTKMTRLAEGEAPHAYVRPQTPVPPFPYASREVVVDAPDGAKLAGTLTLPPGEGPFPAVLFWSGSGQTDRDESVFGHKPFLVLADKLTRAGFATLRLDDRGTGKTIGDVKTLDTEVDDASAAVDFMKKTKELDLKRLGMLGHSTGGMVLAKAAAKTERLAFLVSLAGVAMTGAELIPLQLEAAGRASGAPDDQIKVGVEAQRKVGVAMMKDEAAVKAALVDIFKEPMKERSSVASRHKPNSTKPSGRRWLRSWRRGRCLSNEWIRARSGRSFRSPSSSS